MTAHSAPTSEDLLEITEQIWTSYLDFEGLNPLIPVPALQGTPTVFAWVSVTGAWRGHVVVACSGPASKNVAAALLGIEDRDEIGEADMADALGELANIIGGNVKGLMPEPSALSLPQVVEGERALWPGATEACRIELTWMEEPVVITVLDGKESHEEANAA